MDPDRCSAGIVIRCRNGDSGIAGQLIRVRGMLPQNAIRGCELDCPIGNDSNVLGAFEPKSRSRYFRAAVQHQVIFQAVTCAIVVQCDSRPGIAYINGPEGPDSGPILSRIVADE